MPSGLSTDTLKLSLIIQSTGGATYQVGPRVEGRSRAGGQPMSAR